MLLQEVCHDENELTRMGTYFLYLLFVFFEIILKQLFLVRLFYDCITDNLWDVE